MFERMQQRAAEAFVAGARRASPRLRERAMKGRLGRLIAEQIFAGMARSYDADKGADLDAVVRWELAGGSEPPTIRDLVIRNGRARVVADAGEQPQTTIGLDRQTLVELATGILNAPQAYLAGRLQMTGDVMLAQRLTTLFVVPGGPPGPRPQGGGG